MTISCTISVKGYFIVFAGIGKTVPCGNVCPVLLKILPLTASERKPVFSVTTGKQFQRKQCSSYPRAYNVPTTSVTNFTNI